MNSKHRQLAFSAGFCFGLEVVKVAKGKYAYWLTDEGNTLLAGWARDGLTNEQIARNIGINPDTLYSWEKKYAEISETLKKGKEIADYEVENALCKKALGGDTTAMIFWLKNRRPDKWRDRTEFKAEVDATVKSNPLAGWSDEELKRAAETFFVGGD
jgi:DNA-binding XRE family transcriptional regulator